MILVLAIALSCSLVSNIAAEESCAPQEAEYGIVCVCNATYCDTAGSLPDLADGEYVIITSSESGQRFNITNGTTTLSHIPHEALEGLNSSVYTALLTFPTLTYISLDPRITYQTIEGFGGSFSDSAGLNILNISSDAQENLFKSYFGTDGLDYNLARFPIGGTDFSPRLYAYNDYPVNDTSLSNFTLVDEDYTYRIDLMRRAQELASDDIRIHAAAWTPPPWMKTNNNYTGYSQLLPEYYHAYALYHLRFLQEYYKENITIYALSGGNEPIVSNWADIYLPPSLGWVPKNQAQWIINHFGPMIRESEFPDTKLYILDEQTPFINDLLPIMLKNDSILQYIDGVALHWYLDQVTDMAVIDKVYDVLGNISIINTEASRGVTSDDFGIKIGDWSRGEYYLNYVLQKINHNVTGWIDWNLAVNTEGGPKLTVYASIDAFVIVDAENDQFFKTPMYYAFGHVTKYVPRGSVRIASVTYNGVLNTTFKRPDGMIVIVAMNNGTTAQTVSIDDVSTGQFITYTMEANSMATIVYKPKNLLESA